MQIFIATRCTVNFESFSLMSFPRKHYMKTPNCYSVTNVEP